MLSRRQRKRRRENTYWDKVLAHELRKLERARERQRQREDAEFSALLKEFETPKQADDVQHVYKKRRQVPPARRQPDDRKKNVCLVDALRSVGMAVPYSRHGPFWALADGNDMLRPFGLFACRKSSWRIDVPV